MKTITMVTCIFFLLFTSILGCGSDKTIHGTEYETYGIFNKDNVKDPDIEYKPIWGNIVWGSILFETIIAPIYFFGFSMFEPVKAKNK